MSIDVSVIIVSWNVRDLLQNCIQSVIDQTKSSFEIIVVDNNSEDGTAETIDAAFPEVTVIRNVENLGFAAANNQALEIAAGDYVLLLNPDTVVLDGAIDRSLEWYTDKQGVGCLGCQVWETETEIQKTCFSDPSPLGVLLVETGLHKLFNNSHIFNWPEYNDWDRKSERAVDVVSGMFMLMPAISLKEIGVLDDRFFIYSEEADLCRRMRNAGYLVFFSPIARVIHSQGGGKSTSQIKAMMFVQLQKSKLLYAKKYHGFWGFLFLKTVVVLCQLAKVVIIGITQLLRKSPERREKLSALTASLKYLVLGNLPRGLPK